MADERSYITAFCRPCQAPRYRSIKPLSRKDESRPELFKALDPEAPAPTEGRARCFLCQDILVFIADNNLPPLDQKSAPVRPHSQPVDLTAPSELFQHESDEVLPLPVTPTDFAVQVETLFELGLNEELKYFQDYPDAILLVTNKRIVRVRKG